MEEWLHHAAFVVSIRKPGVDGYFRYFPRLMLGLLLRVGHSEMDHCRSRKKGIYMTSDNFGDNMFFRRGLQLGAMRLRLATNSPYVKTTVVVKGTC